MTSYHNHGDVLDPAEFCHVAHLLGIDITPADMWKAGAWQQMIDAAGIDVHVHAGDVISQTLWNDIVLRLHQAGHTGLPDRSQT